MVPSSKDAHISDIFLTGMNLQYYCSFIDLEARHQKHSLEEEAHPFKETSTDFVMLRSSYKTS